MGLEIGLSVKGIMLYSSKKNTQVEFKEKTYPYLKNGIVRIKMTNDRNQVIAQVWKQDFDNLNKYSTYTYPLSVLFNKLESNDSIPTLDDHQLVPYYENSEVIIYYDENYPLQHLISSNTLILYLMSLIFISIISYIILCKIHRKHIDSPLNEINKYTSSNTLPIFNVRKYKQTANLFDAINKTKQTNEENRFKISFLSILLSSARHEVSKAIKCLYFGTVDNIYDPKQDCLNTLSKTEKMLNTGDNFSSSIIGKNSIKIGSIFKLGFNDNKTEKIIIDFIENISIRKELPIYDIASINGIFSIPSTSFLDPDDTHLLIINPNNVTVSSFKNHVSKYKNISIFKILVTGEETTRPIWNNYFKEGNLDIHYISTPIDPTQIIEKVFLNINNLHSTNQTNVKIKNVIKFEQKNK